MRAILTLGVSIFITACVADPDSGSSNEGEPCETTSNCLNSLICIEQICLAPPGGTPSDATPPDAATWDATVDGQVLDQGLVDQRPPAPQLAEAYLIAIAASVDPNKPLVFLGWPEPSGGENPILRLRMQALANETREPVGEIFEARAQANEGAFTLDFGRIEIDGAADPIIPGAPILAELQLVTPSIDQLCGTIGGQIIQPAALPLEGTWGAVALVDEDVDGVELMSRCP